MKYFISQKQSKKVSNQLKLGRMTKVRKFVFEASDSRFNSQISQFNTTNVSLTLRQYWVKWCFLVATPRTRYTL